MDSDRAVRARNTLSDPFGSALALCLIAARVEVGISTAAKAVRMRFAFAEVFVSNGRR
jgi:hypothetical protein